MPPAPTLQVIRNPVDVVLSAFLFHTQVPAPEEWIDRMQINGYGALWVSAA